jgi:hypothetical protein
METAEVLREIRDELKEIKAIIYGYAIWKTDKVHIDSEINEEFEQ